MQRIRNVLADILVGVVLIVAAFWLLRGVFRVVYWGVSTVVILVAIVVAVRVATKLRG